MLPAISMKNKRVVLNGLSDQIRVRSYSVSITNGTHQGSVLFSRVFSVNLDDPMKQLRQLDLGCPMCGFWVGEAGYADILNLPIPSRSAIKKMLETCDTFARSFNLQFSTDPDPAKSKSKFLYMWGSMEPAYPLPLKLNGSELP